MSCRGLGQYVSFFECAYPQVLPDAMAPYLTLNSGGVNAALASEVPQQMSYTGMGCVGCGNPGLGCGCAGGCAGGCGVSGLTMDGTGLFGTGLFTGGLDFTTWGAWEYGVAALGAYMLYSMVFTTKVQARAVSGRIRSRGKKIRRGFTD